MKTATTSQTIALHWSVITVITVLIYHNVFSHEFQLQWDDQWQVINSMTNDGISLKNLQTIFASINNSQYSPINQLYYTFIHLCFGYSSLAFHIGNLLFHIFNAYLVYLLAYSFIRSHFSTQKVLSISFFTALLFAIHPIQVETVCWISASKIVLSTFFYLLALVSYIQYVRNNSKWQYLWVSIASCILAMGCKEQSVIIVPCLLLFDWMLFKRNMRSLKVYIEKIYYLIPTIIIFIITLIANKDTGEEIIGYTLVDRFIFLCYSSFKYLLISVIPFKLSYLYPFPFQVGEKIPMALWIYPFVILFIGYVIYLCRRKTLLVFCTLFFILHLLPVLHVIPLPRYVIAADRYLYIPYISFAFGLSILLYHLYERQRKWILYIGFIYCSYLCVYAAYYAPVWKNSDTLKKHYKEILKKRETKFSINYKNEKQ